MLDKLHVMLVSRRRNLSFSLQLSYRFIKTLLAVFAFMVIGSFVFLFFNARATVENLSLGMVERENLTLLQRLQQLKTELAAEHADFSDQIAQDNRERSFLQIAHIHPDVWAMGVGGTGDPSSYEGLAGHTRELLRDINQSMEILSSQSRLRHSSLKEIENQFARNSELWAHIPSTNPLPGHRIGSGFGYRVDPINKSIRMHWGVDLGAPVGTPIQASADGVVSYTGWNMGYGLCLDIDHGYGFKSRYAHCHSLLVNAGDLVKRGQVIATVGATGRVTCSHLHYEVHVSGVKVNPAKYIDQSSIVFD